MILDNISTVLTVRKGSERVKNKNLRSFCKKNLLIYKIETLLKVKSIKNIVINTDSNEAIKIAKDYGIGYHLRDPYFASSECPNNEFWGHIAENTKTEYILFTHCTNPLIKVSTYEDFINFFVKNRQEHDSFNSVSEVKEFLILNQKPINFDFNKAPNSQNLPDVIKLNFAINILPTSLMLNKKSLIGDKPFFYKLKDEEGFDINTNLEFSYGEFLFDQAKKNL
jgi:CMP-N-acetylneuraminic acid synthetase|tara:strand:- start:505 stop:1176 length:672 start_codon:yes stop_codon:yes gene_type:complete